MILKSYFCKNKNKHNIKHLIVIAGPTGIGKSKISVEIAKILGADIFSADSRQVYKEMSIGTAKPSEKEMQQVAHHLIGHISIHDEYNVGKYEQEISNLLKLYFESRDIAILCGGTGLYIDAVINGIDEFPDISETSKKTVDEWFKKYGISFLQEKLKSVDEAYYNTVDINNHRRITRALEVYEETGQSYSSYLQKINTSRNLSQYLSY